MIERGVRILLVGSVPEKLKRRYARFENIIMKCRVTHNEVATLISQSRFGVNLFRDIYPFNLQPATKVMEYCAVGIPVVTSDYRWIRNFEREKNQIFSSFLTICLILTLKNWRDIHLLMLICLNTNGMKS